MAVVELRSAGIAGRRPLAEMNRSARRDVRAKSTAAKTRFDDRLEIGISDRLPALRVLAFDRTFQLGEACRWKTGSER